jgi:hypothetical protein
MRTKDTGMTKEEQNIEDVEFILREVQRFALMHPSDLIRHLQENRGETFATLSRTRGGIVFLVGLPTITSMS